MVSAKVIAPVPWFPLTSNIFGEYSKYAKVPLNESRHQIEIAHPRYLVFPKISMNVTPFFLAKSMLKAAQDMIRQGFDFDIIDAHYFYPDGVAAVKVAEILKKPIVITARGTDLNLIPQYPKPRQLIKEAANHANAIVTVCQALKDVLLDMDVSERKITVLRNGVDLRKFFPPPDRNELRKKLNIEGKTILSVGHLIERKGHDLVLEAMQRLPNIKLLIAGDGEEFDNLRQLAIALNVNDRVTFLGAIEHGYMKNYYGAVDALILASSREGWANVLLESMACGTPVVATNIWGTPEVVASKEAGLLVNRDSKSIATGIQYLLDNYPDRSQTRNYAEKFSWDSTTEGQLSIFNDLLERKR